MVSPVDEYENEHWDEIHGGKETLMSEVCDVCCTRMEVETYCPTCRATTGPEVKLRSLEALAREYGLPAQVESLLRVYESDGSTRYQDEFSRRNITRAEALALLKGAKDE